MPVAKYFIGAIKQRSRRPKSVEKPDAENRQESSRYERKTLKRGNPAPPGQFLRVPKKTSTTMPQSFEKGKNGEKGTRGQHCESQKSKIRAFLPSAWPSIHPVAGHGRREEANNREVIMPVNWWGKKKKNL